MERRTLDRAAQWSSGAVIQSTPSGHYVYAHRKLSDGDIFYIGKGKSRRAWSKVGRHPKWMRIVDEHGYSAHVLMDGLSESCALSLEKVLIFSLRSMGLVNVVDGGGGTSGWRHSDETKIRIGQASKNRTVSQKALDALRAYNTGKTLTTEHRAKLSAAKSGRRRGPMSLETREKIAASHAGMKASDETKEKLRASHVGKCSGRENPKYDHTHRCFVHISGANFEGTRADFMSANGLAHGCVSALINGHRKTVKGWAVA